GGEPDQRAVGDRPALPGAGAAAAGLRLAGARRGRGADQLARGLRGRAQAPGRPLRAARRQGPRVTRPATDAIAPFFIVGNVDRTIAFYRDRLGFEVTFQDSPSDPFFAIVARDRAQIFLKHFGAETPPLPNPVRHPDAKWDAYVHAPDPDGLAADFAAKGAAFRVPLGDTGEGLRGFE